MESSSLTKLRVFTGSLGPISSVTTRQCFQLVCGTLAQLVEQRTFNPFVVGSTPARPTKYLNKINNLASVRKTGVFLFVGRCQIRCQISCRIPGRTATSPPVPTRSQSPGNSGISLGQRCFSFPSQHQPPQHPPAAAHPLAQFGGHLIPASFVHPAAQRAGLEVVRTQVVGKVN